MEDSVRRGKPGSLAYVAMTLWRQMLRDEGQRWDIFRSGKPRQRVTVKLGEAPPGFMWYPHFAVTFTALPGGLCLLQVTDDEDEACGHYWQHLLAELDRLGLADVRTAAAENAAGAQPGAKDAAASPKHAASPGRGRLPENQWAGEQIAAGAPYDEVFAGWKNRRKQVGRGALDNYEESFKRAIQ